MNPPTPKGNDPPVQGDNQQTLLQWTSDPLPDVLQTGIQANAAAARLEVGPIPLTRVADYELLKEIGRGGMGVVFKARHVRLNRIVALKMIRGGALANTDELQRFEKEASAAARLQHSNIVALYEVSNYNQQPFLSMEYIGGTSLAERLSLGPLPSRRAAAYLEATAHAVHYAHSKGILHRDLKPANILLDDNDQPKVTDFGLAKQMETGSDQTRTGAVLGTPSYMSPEQATGRKDIGPASDIYSLGAILYELITGKPPFCGETPLATLNLVTEQEALPPRVLNPSVDRDLETICLKCLEKAPARRYDSAAALARDLHRYLDGEAISARRVSRVGRTFKWCQRNPAWTALSVFILLVLSAFMVYQWYVAFEEKELRADAEHANRLARLRLETMRHLLYLSEMRQAQQTLRRADFDGVERILSEHWQPKDGQRDLRDWEWYFLKDQCQSRLAFCTHADRAFAVAYRPGGKQFASAGGSLDRPGEIKVWDVRAGQCLWTLLGHANVITALAYHPEKNLLASSSYDQTVKIWDLKSGEPLLTLRGHQGTVCHVAFSPRGDRLASAGNDKTVRLWDYQQYARDPSTGVQVFAEHEGAVTSVAFHPEGMLLASGSRDRSIRLWNLATGQVDRKLTGHEGAVETLIFNTTGTLLVSGGGRGLQHGEICFWETQTGKLGQSHYGLSDRILSLSISRDDKIAAAASDGTLRIWNPQVSSEPLTLHADPQMLAGVAFAPDGYSLVSAGRNGRISLWNSSGGLETRTLSAPGVMETVAFHPQAPILAAAGPNHGDIRVWNLNDPDTPTIIPGPRSGVFSLAFSPNGRVLAAAGGDAAIRLVDFRSLDKAPILLQGHTAPIHALAYHPAGQVLASAGDDEIIRLYDAANGRLLNTLTGHGNGILCLAFSPDGGWLASGSYDKTVRLWDLTTGKQEGLLAGHTGSIKALSFSSDGGTLATASSDKSIRVWDIARRKELFKLEHSPAPLHSLAYHPKGHRLVSVGQDRMIRLWDIVTRQEILEFEENIGSIRQVVFSADGRDLAGAGNGVVRVWQASRDLPDARVKR